jgi:hypothetical protein
MNEKSIVASAMRARIDSKGTEERHCVGRVVEQCFAQGHDINLVGTDRLTVI